MRPDMAKVVTERPRRGSHNKSLKTGVRVRVQDVDRAEELDDFDGGPTRHPVSSHGQHGWDAKEFSDLLGPLRGYLRKQVGRPWDKVYSELSATLDRRGVSGSHIWDHVKMEVSQNCWLGVSGKIYEVSRFGNSSEADGLYVHPITRLLCYRHRPQARMARETADRYSLQKRLRAIGLLLPQVESRYLDWRTKKKLWEDALPELADWRIVDDLTVLQRVRTVWYVHRFERLNPNERVGTKMIGDRQVPVLRSSLKEPRFRRVSLRQVGKREKKQWGLM